MTALLRVPPLARQLAHVVQHGDPVPFPVKWGSRAALEGAKGMLRLQRTLGNHAVTRLQVESRLGRERVQRVDGLPAPGGGGAPAGMFPDLDRIPAPLRPIVQNILIAIQTGVLRVSAAQRDALLHLLADLVGELGLANALPGSASALPGQSNALPAPGGNAPAPVLPPVRLSVVVGAILQTDPASFFGNTELWLPGDFFLRHPLDVTGLGGIFAQPRADGARGLPPAPAALPGPPPPPPPPPVVLQFMLHLGQYAKASNQVLWTYQALKFDMAKAAKLVPVTAAWPAMTQPQVMQAATIYQASRGNLQHVNSWIKGGMKPPAAPLKAHVSPASKAGVGPAAPYSPLDPRGGVDANEWIAYRTSIADLSSASQLMKANAQANNTGVKNQIDPDIAQTVHDYATDAQQIDLLVKADIQPKRDVAGRLKYYADHYATIPKQNSLEHVDTYNVVQHLHSVGALWATWKNNRLKATGKGDFDTLLEGANVAFWDRNPGVFGQPWATRNPTMVKAKLSANRLAVLEGLQQNLGNIRANFNRGGHKTNPTGGGGAGGTEYNAEPGPNANAVGTVKWYATVQQVNPAGVKRFIHFKNKWFYVPQHYVTPKGWAGPGAYQLIIDA